MRSYPSIWHLWWMMMQSSTLHHGCHHHRTQSEDCSWKPIINITDHTHALAINRLECIGFQYSVRKMVATSNTAPESAPTALRARRETTNDNNNLFLSLSLYLFYHLPTLLNREQHGEAFLCYVLECARDREQIDANPHTLRYAVAAKTRMPILIQKPYK